MFSIQYMIYKNESVCPKCGQRLKYYDSVKRIVRIKYGRKTIIRVRRFRCIGCQAIHREIPEFIFPYKQYESEIIIGVLDGLITCETLGFEDFPCETTMERWISQMKSADTTEVVFTEIQF